MNKIRQRITHILRSPARTVKQLLYALAELVWPTRCVGCEKLGVLLCDSCRQSLPRIDQDLACPRCGAPFGKLVCTECTPVHEPVSMAFSQARCTLEFTDLSRRLIVAYKDGIEERLAPLLAQLMCQAIPLEWRLWADVVTWIPSDEEAMRRRGFDHMALIALSLSEQTGLPVAPLLHKQARKDQRHLNRRQRMENMKAVFSLREPTAQAPQAPPKKQLSPMIDRRLSMKNIILIDDVLTTGATLDAAAQVLLGAGAQEIRVITLCRVW